MVGRVGCRRQWRVATPAPEVETGLAAAVGISPLLARLLVNRGFADAARCEAFLDARLAKHVRSPMLFRDMGRAAERLVDAVARGELIGIYGDYDVDGISGSALLLRFFRELGADPLCHIPDRLRDGYGLNEAGVRGLAGGGVRVMVTVDCGGVNHAEIALANSLGVDVIVCDHHQVSGTPLPAHAVLNPVEADAGFPFGGLCGVGVAFYLALGVRMLLRERGGGAPVPDLRRSLDLVALGTVADLVPLVEENRVLVKYGLRELAVSERPGIVALKTVSGVRRLSAGVVAFRLAPRLNAGGRLADAGRAVELLTTDDRERADKLAAELDEENRTRQIIERRILGEAVAMVEQGGAIGDRRSLVLASPDWHPGVIGIVASRLVERYYRPTILIAGEGGRGVARGSGRSIRGVDLYEVIRSCRDHLEGFGGHRMAAGLSISPERIPLFARQVETAVAARTRPEDFIPVLLADCEIELGAVDDRFFADLERLEPYGAGNPEPVFVSRGVRVHSHRIVGENHLKLSVEQDGRRLPAIAFGMAERSVEVGDRLDILHSPMINQWNGQATVELRIHDLRPPGEEQDVAAPTGDATGHRPTPAAPRS